MTPADEYRIQAAALAAQARDEKHANVRKELLQLSKLYLRLAEQADKNSWPAPGSEDTELGVLMGPEVRHGEAEVHARVQA